MDIYVQKYLMSGLLILNYTYNIMPWLWVHGPTFWIPARAKIFAFLKKSCNLALDSRVWSLKLTSHLLLMLGLKMLVPVYSSASQAVCHDTLTNREQLLGASRENWRSTKEVSSKILKLAWRCRALKAIIGSFQCSGRRHTVDCLHRPVR